MGRKRPSISQTHEEIDGVLAIINAGISTNVEQGVNASDEEFLSIVTRRTYEVSKLARIKAKEGYEEQVIEQIKCNLREERQGKASKLK